MSPSTRERDNARRRADEWSARQSLAREATLSRRRTALAVVAGVIVAGLVVVGVIAVINGRDGKDAASPPAATASPSSPEQPSPATPAEPAPDKALAENRTWTGTIATSQGDLGVELFGDRAPAAVASFVTLAQKNFFNDIACHRLTTEGIFVLQCGDPAGNGSGGPGYSFGPVENAPADDVYPTGTLAMARAGGAADSQGSQFFIVYEDSPIPADAAGGYTVFGKVTSGLETVQEVADAGVAGGATDGPPAQKIALGAVTLQ